jgi:AraC-like DNA-binding protein
MGSPRNTSRLVFALHEWTALARASEYRVKNLSVVLKCCPRSIERLILKETSLSPKQWMLKIRLEASLVLLAKGMSVEAVAIQLHYRQTTYFSREFKRHFGVKPSRFHKVG